MMANDLKYFCDSQRHLVCVPYSIENLHKMAEDLGIDRAWFHKGASYPHYDIPKRRVAEISSRCTLVSPRDILNIVKGGQMEPTKVEESKINEVHLNLHGKILFSAITSWLLGKEPNLKIKGTRHQIEQLSKTLNALREFHEEMKKPDADVKTVMKKLGIKNYQIKQFERMFGIKWPLQL